MRKKRQVSLKMSLVGKNLIKQYFKLKLTSKNPSNVFINSSVVPECVEQMKMAFPPKASASRATMVYMDGIVASSFSGDLFTQNVQNVFTDISDLWRTSSTFA